MEANAFSHLNWRPALKIIPFTFSSLTEIDVIWFCLHVCLSKLCAQGGSRVENHQDSASSVHPLQPIAKINRMKETLTGHENNAENAKFSIDIIWYNLCSNLTGEKARVYYHMTSYYPCHFFLHPMAMAISPTKHKY